MVEIIENFTTIGGIYFKGGIVLKIIVYGSTRDRAYNKLQDLLDNMKYGKVNRVNKNSFNFTVELKNGDLYIALLAFEGAKGHKWDYAYIDHRIDKEIVNNIILPGCLHSNYGEKLEEHYQIYL